MIYYTRSCDSVKAKKFVLRVHFSLPNICPISAGGMKPPDIPLPKSD